MARHFDSLQQEAGSVVQEWRRQSYDREMRLATWLLVGNAAALLACFNAAISGRVCNWQVLQHFGGAFLVGMVFVMASVVLTGEVVSRAVARMTALGSAYRQAAIAIDANNELRARANALDVTANQRILANDTVIEQSMRTIEASTREPQTEKVLHAFAQWFIALGALCLGGALLVAVNSDAVQSALCVR
jgi:hypothetical protein